jgi:glutathione S-transferase
MCFLPVFVSFSPLRLRRCLQELLAALAVVSKAYAAAGGPFFFGAAPSLPDVLLFPFLARLPVLKHYRGFEVPAEAPEFAALRRCVGRSVRDT